jgi:hypothetical protein
MWTCTAGSVVRRLMVSINNDVVCHTIESYTIYAFFLSMHI